MPRWSTTHVEVGLLRLHVTRAGGGSGPPLVLAHGVGDDGPCWTAVAGELATDHPVALVDARGHGRSEAPADHAYGPEVQAADLAGVIAGLQLDRPVVLGHSMGAITAMALAGMRPDVRAIVLEDPPPVWVGDPAEEEAPKVVHRRAESARSLSALKRRTQAELVDEQRAAAPGWPDEEIRRWAEAKHRFDPSVISLFDQRLDRRLDWRAVLGAIRCPVLLVTGTPARGALVAPEHAAAFRARVPQAEVAHLDGAGHSIRHDRPEAYLAAVRGFLRAV